MTEHQKARRAAKSAAFFAARARAAAVAGDAREARRLGEWADRKGAERLRAEHAAPVARIGSPNFHQRLMGALDAAQQSGQAFPAHGAIRRAVRAANMHGRQFQSAAELVAAVKAFSPWLAEKVEAVAQAA